MGTKRKIFKKKLATPYISKTILEGVEDKEEDEEDAIPLSKWTRTKKVIRKEKRKSLTPTPP